MAPMMEAADCETEPEPPYDEYAETGIGERDGGGCPDPERPEKPPPGEPEFPVAYIMPDEAMNCEAMLGADMPPPPLP